MPDPSPPHLDVYTLPAREAALHAAPGAAAPGARLEANGVGEEAHIGFWTDRHERVSWVVPLRQGGRYEVRLCYACTPAEAGSVVAVGAEGCGFVTAQLESTGGYARFVSLTLRGRLPLQPGPTRLLVRVLRQVGQAVMNLRSVTLLRCGGRPLPPAPRLAVETSTQGVLQGGLGAQVVLCARVVAAKAPERLRAGEPQLGQRFKLRDAADSGDLPTQAVPLGAEAALAARALHALQHGERVLVRGELQEQRGAVVLHMADLSAEPPASAVLGPSAAELAEADRWLQERLGRDDLFPALRGDLAQLCGLPPVPEEAPPGDRGALALRLLLLQAVSGEAGEAGNPRLAVALWGAGEAALARAAEALCFTGEPTWSPPRPSRGAALLRGQVGQRGRGGWAGAAGWMTRQDRGTLTVAAAQLLTCSAAERRALRAALLEVLGAGQLVSAGAPGYAQRTRAALLLLGESGALLQLLCGQGDALEAGGVGSLRLDLPFALELVTSVDCALHLTTPLSLPDWAGEWVGTPLQEASAAHAAAPLEPAALRQLRLRLARILERSPHVDLRPVAGAVEHLAGAGAQVQRALLLPVLGPERTQLLHDRYAGRLRHAVLKLVAASARLAGRVEAEEADVKDAWSFVAFRLEHLRWLRSALQMSGLPPGAEGEEPPEEALARFQELLEERGWEAQVEALAALSPPGAEDP